MKKKYPCAVCLGQCQNDVIERHLCNMWVHKNCVPMTDEFMHKWAGQEYLQFSCPSCINRDSDFNFSRVLSILENSDNYFYAAKTAQLILETYNISLRLYVLSSLSVE